MGYSPPRMIPPSLHCKTTLPTVALLLAGAVLLACAGCGSSAQPPPDGGVTNLDAAAGDQANGADSGQALVKFCHLLGRGSDPTTMTVELGDPVLARFTASTGNCAPSPGIPCPIIPAGNVRLRLIEDDKLLSVRTITIEADREYVLRDSIPTGMIWVLPTEVNRGSCARVDSPF